MAADDLAALGVHDKDHDAAVRKLPLYEVGRLSPASPMVVFKWRPGWRWAIVARTRDSGAWRPADGGPSCATAGSGAVAAAANRAMMTSRRFMVRHLAALD